MTSFIRAYGKVVMVTEHGPITLDDSQCERLLDIWGEAEGPAAARLFNALYDAHMANGGVPRCWPHPAPKSAGHQLNAI